MAGLNKVMLIGHIGNSPETRYLPSGNAVTSFSMATSETWKDKQTGERQERTEWHRCTAFGKLAEIIGEYGHKGRQVYVEGRIRTEEYEKDGQKRYATKIMVDTFQMLGKKEDGGQSSGQRNSNASSGSSGQQSSQPSSQSSFDDDEIPF